MTEPAEAEVEAATLAVKEIDVGDGCFFWPEEAEALARAALTAAAQVRERAGPALEIRDNGKNPLITVSSDDVLTWMRNLADAAGYQDRETCGFQINVEQEFAAGQKFHVGVPMLTLMVSNVPNSRRAPAPPDLGPLPIYGATEAPSDGITVQCKCGWSGKQSALVWVSTTSVSFFCPQCCAEFAAFPATEDQGPDVLGERKGVVE